MQYHVSEITPDYACCTIEVSPFEQNCRVIWNKLSKIGVLIDPGTDLTHIFEKIQQHNIKIKEIWITHGHIDHAGEALDAAEKLNVKIIGPHIKDKELLENMREHVENMKDKFPIYQYFINTKNCTPSKWLEEGDKLEIDGLEFTVLYCPGHSPGHVAYHSEKAKCLISGDVLFYESVGRTDLYGSCQNTLKRTILEKILPLSDDTLVLSGHGQDFTLGEVRNRNAFLVKWASGK